jgi:ribosomal protein L7/L12
MVMKVRELHLGKKILDPDTEREELISIMKCANRIWKIRNKIKNGELDDKHQINMNDQIEDYIAQNQKINAIKYYRQEMDENYDFKVSLRDAKEYIDNTAEDMRRRGIIK